MGTQTVTTTNKPYQADYLDYGFDEAKKMYQTGGPPVYYPGQTVAGMNNFQTGAINNLGNYNPNAVGAYTNVGNQFMGGAAGAVNTLGNIAGMQQGPQANMMSMGQLNQYQPMINQMVDAATQQGMRTYNEQFMPNLNANAAASGNMGSSRAGIAQGIAQRGIAEQATQVGANAMNNLFNQGNQMNIANANLGQNFLNTQMNAATNMGKFAGAGADMINSADMSQLGGYTTNLDAGQYQQDQDQTQINADIERYNYNQNADNQWLQNYLSMVSGNYGTSGTQTTNTPNPSFGRQLFSTALNMGGAALMGGRAPFSYNTWFGGNGGKRG